MADRYSFQSPFSRGHGSDPWVTVGNVAVTTTVAVTALSTLGILLFVVEGGLGPVGQAIVLTDDAILGGQIWRFLTYIVPATGDFFWEILGLVFFYLIGSQLERIMGRQVFTSLFLALMFIPAILAVLAAVAVGQGFALGGIDSIFFGMAAGYSAAQPEARTFFNIPFWVLIAFFFVIQLLSILATRSIAGLVLLILSTGIGLVVTRSLGFSNVEWIPAVKLPSFMGGGPAPSTPSPKAPKKRGKRFGRKKKAAGNANLRSVPTGATSSASDAEIDALLDQVSEQGMGSLTKQQKQALERHAKEMRKRRDS